jgi:hypothetical protein
MALGQPGEGMGCLCEGAHPRGTCAYLVCDFVTSFFSPGNGERTPSEQCGTRAFLICSFDHCGEAFALKIEK